MAVPKRKHSPSRRDSRRSQIKHTPPTLIACKNCGKPKRPHFLCPSCKQ